jgi:hypothetical protein
MEIKADTHVYLYLFPLLHNWWHSICNKDVHISIFISYFIHLLYTGDHPISAYVVLTHYCPQIQSILFHAYNCTLSNSSLMNICIVSKCLL